MHIRFMNSMYQKVLIVVVVPSHMDNQGQEITSLAQIYIYMEIQRSTDTYDPMHICCGMFLVSYLDSGSPRNRVDFQRGSGLGQHYKKPSHLLTIQFVPT